MKEQFYLTNDIAIINFDMGCPETKSGLLKTESFKYFAVKYMEYLKNSDPDLYAWASAGKPDRKAVDDICSLARTALVFELDEIENSYLENEDKFLEFIEGIFDFWKDHQGILLQPTCGGI